MKVSIDALFFPHRQGCCRFERYWSLKGKDCSDIRNGYRKSNAGSHVIFYRQISGDTIEIVRILHGRMDIETRLSTLSSR